VPIDVTRDVFALAEAFTISRGSRTQAQVLTARFYDRGVSGWGECVPYARYEETLDSVEAQILGLEGALTPEVIQEGLPPGAARNAVDCAWWDWSAKRQGVRIWELFQGMAAPGPVITAFTLSLDTPAKMRDQAARNAHRPLLKTKLGGGEDDIARIEAVRAGAPDARIIVDANEGWSADLYKALAPVLVRLGVEMVEQPLPAGEDDALLELERVLPVCADESCHDRASLPALRGKYDMVNIKLDKTGGLTEALALKKAAEAEGFSIMIGCMVGSSLAMAPAILLAQGVSVVDLDGPLLLAEDREVPLLFDAAGVHPPDAALWG
jgi:L-alanine-DL-glutamate epimerase-like enolase superfamily enzyme